MRWIVLALLVANIAVFAWFQTAGKAVSERRADAPERDTAGARLELLEEAGPDFVRQSAPEPELPATPAESRAEDSASRLNGDPAVDPVGGVGERICTILGPFAEAYQGNDVVERLAALSVEGDLRQLEMPGRMRYWVFLDPLGSSREAFNRLRELQAAGIDSYVIPKGSLENGISFGIFNEPARAEKLLNELTAKGVAAKSREEPEMHLERWVVIPPGGADALAEDFWVRIARDYPDLDRRQNLCSELAPE